MVKNRPTLKLNLSGEALLVLQAKLHSIVMPKAIMAKDIAVKDLAKEKVREEKKQKQKVLKANLTEKQFYCMLESLRKTHKKTFPAKGEPLVPLAIGIHKEIAKHFNISTKKAFYFCRMYCGTKHYKMTCEKHGASRLNLKGEQTGKID